MKMLDCIICDDIRREIANKITIVGAYNDRIEFISNTAQAPVKFPLFIRCSMYLRLLNDDKVEYNEILITLTNLGDVVFEINVEIPKEHDIYRPIVIPIPIQSLKVVGVGPLEVVVKVKKDKNLIQELRPNYDINFTVKES